MDNPFDITNDIKGLTLDNLRDVVERTRKLSGDIPIFIDYNTSNNANAKMCVVNHIYNNITFSN
jgi:hypothetical protein